MCIFNEPVKEVNGTQILVVPTPDGRQITVYQNEVGMSENVKPKANQPLNAMILPAPLHLTNNSNNTIELLDLSSNEKLFEELDQCFPKEAPKYLSRGFVASDSSSPRSSYLEVKQVGGYKVSVARSIPDLRKIDPSVFAVKPNIDELLCKHYANNFAFVICGFDSNSGVKPHPIGYVSDRLKPDVMFVPTRHEHGHSDSSGKHEFDHKIYSVNTTNKCGESVEDCVANFKKDNTPFNEATRKPLMVLAKQPFLKHLPPVAVLRRLEIKGEHDNQDFEFGVIPNAEIEKARAPYETHIKQLKELEEIRAQGKQNAANSSNTSSNEGQNEVCIMM